MRFLPVFMRVDGKKIVVIGGGDAAVAKLRSLKRTSGRIVVIAQEFDDEINKWAREGLLDIEKRAWTEADLDSAVLAYAATENPHENSKIAELSRGLNIPVNAADQSEDCSFYSAAIVDRDPVVIAIGSEGTSPALTRAIKADLETRLRPQTGEVALTLKALRSHLSQKVAELSERQKFWGRFFEGRRNLGKLTGMSSDQLRSRYEDLLSKSDASESPGQVAFVGAGPGSVDLLTLGAQRRLHMADVVIYDRLVSEEVLDLGRREAKYIYVGKKPGKHQKSQDEINAILVKEASKGQFVVRLKGGDPSVFGRLDEEVDALTEAGVEFEIVPGITAASAAAATIGRSLTSRGQNRSIPLLTGHDAKGFAEQDWASLARTSSRAAIYMGVGAARFIQGRLLLHGADQNLPVTIVENASRENEVVVGTDLGNLVQAIENNGIKGPAMLMLGYAPYEKVVPIKDNMRVAV